MDAPILIEGQPSWLLDTIGGQFEVLVFGEAPSLDCISQGDIEAVVTVVGREFEDYQGILSERYDAGSGAVYLLRPDQHVAARWRNFDLDKIKSAIAKSTCQQIH